MQEGVEARRIKTSGSGKWEDLFYHFKRSRVGAIEEYKGADEMTKQLQTTPDSWDTFEKMLDNFTPDQGFILGTGSDGSSALELASDASR